MVKTPTVEIKWITKNYSTLKNAGKDGDRKKQRTDEIEDKQPEDRFQLCHTDNQM